MVNNEHRKAAVRDRLTLAKFPRRSGAKFTDENDHNPMVLKGCPGCHGRGLLCDHSEHSNGRQTISTDPCTKCGGSGVIAEVEPFFTNNASEVQATARLDGWIKCPNCNWSFTIRDPHAWTGLRHLRCGQKIRVIEA